MPTFRPLAAAALLLQACTSAPTLPSAPELGAAVDALAAEALARQGFPGLAVVVMRGDEVLVARGYGVESLTRGDAVTARTQFMHNSIGKHFTATMVAALAEEGKLGLDDPVIRHLPDFKQLPPSLTVRHLLTQTSGLREAMAIQAIWPVLDRSDSTWRDLRPVLRDAAAVDWPPGSRWSYSNTNYFLLEALAAEVGGKPLAELYHERFFRPRGLSTMRVCPFQTPDVPGTAVGYVTLKDKLERGPPVNNVVTLGAGGLCGNALDLARWARLLGTGRIVSARSYEQMTTPARLADGTRAEYGFGLGLMQLDGVRRVGHGGIGFGYSSTVGYYPDAGLTIAVLANRFGFPDALERQIARRALGLREPDRSDVGISAEQRARWAGRYDVGMAGWMPTLFERDGRLWVQLFGPTSTYALIRTPDGTVVPEAVPDGIELRFGETASGVTARIRTFGTQPWHGVRVGEASAPQ